MKIPWCALRRAPIVAVLVAISLFAGVPVALAYITSDLNNWNLSESTSTYGNGTPFSISGGTDGRASFRWLDQPNKTTVISANSCGDYSLLGNSIVTADTSYRTLFYGGTSQCFVMRGRTAAGTGSMYDHDGRSER